MRNLLSQIPMAIFITVFILKIILKAITMVFSQQSSQKHTQRTDIYGFLVTNKLKRVNMETRKIKQIS